MLILIIGIVVFLGVHSLPTARGLRANLIARFGEQTYKGLYSLAAFIGFALIVWGFSRYRAEGLIPVWAPPLWTRHLTIALMWFAFVALACMNPAPGRIRGWLRHPMLAGVTIWALAHLLANGDAGGMLLFGAFLIWAVYDRIAVVRRGDYGAASVAAFTRADGMALIVGTLAYLAMIALHPWLIGVRVIGWP
ncbi:MAG: NnrU family protein [Roseiarcus sp.]